MYRIAPKYTSPARPAICQKCGQEPVYISPRGKPGALCVLCFFQALVEAGIFAPSPARKSVNVLYAAGKGVAVAILILVMLSILAAPAYADPPDNLSWPGPFGAEQAYYDGVRDACLFAGVAMGLTYQEADLQCRLFVRLAKQGDWYHNRAAGWDGLQRQPAGWGQEI